MAITCSVGIRVTLPGGEEGILPLDELPGGVSGGTWTENIALRQTTEIDLGGGYKAIRITSFTMMTPEGAYITFNMG